MTCNYSGSYWRVLSTKGFEGLLYFDGGQCFEGYDNQWRWQCYGHEQWSWLIESSQALGLIWKPNHHQFGTKHCSWVVVVKAWAFLSFDLSFALKRRPAHRKQWFIRCRCSVIVRGNTNSKQERRRDRWWIEKKLSCCLTSLCILNPTGSWDRRTS